MKYIYLFLVSTFLFSCVAESDDNNINDQDPSNLNVTISSANDATGIVAISATATNAISFEFYMGDGSTDPIIQNEGSYTHTYLSNGSYDIEVRVYGPSGRFISYSERVILDSGDPVDVNGGYSTPLSYEGMDLVWNDEFSGSTLNADDWSHDIGNGCPNLCGWGNNELEYYRAENTSVADGFLTIEAKKQSFSGYDYTSSKILSQNKQTFEFGRIDVRAKLPEGQGIWPAIWMLGTNITSVGWPKCGEIDIMEMVGGQGRENTVGGNVFWYNGSGQEDEPQSYTLAEGTFADEFHVFSIVWTETNITWYVDDIPYHSFNTNSVERSEFQEPFYIILNVAVGGNWPGSPDAGTIFPTQMQVDYVRVFQDK